MTNTKFRKRALLSSVAMLLVALIALGSATFAWFSVRRDADASTLTASTTKSSTLTISQINNNNWTNDLRFANMDAGSNTKKAIVTAESLKPVSFDRTNWVAADAAGNNLGYKKASATMTTVSDPITQNYAVGAPVYVKYGLDDGDGNFDLGVSVTLSENTANSSDLDYARVAIVPLSEDDSTVSYSVGSAFVVGTNNNDFSANPSSYSAPNMTPVTTGDNKTTVASTTTENIFIGNIDEGKVYGFMVYAYYEGTDLECKDNYAGTTFTVALNFHEVHDPNAAP